MLNDNEIECNVCHTPLQEPYITCAECDIKINSYRSCLRCFSIGAETGTHLNSHAYKITHDNIKVFPNSDWSAREERHLIELIKRYGFGNWSDISRVIGTRNENECRDHYLQFYFQNVFKKACGITKYPYTPLSTPYLYRSNVVEPPRYRSDITQNNFMAGYRYERSDFETLFDSSAENVISNMHLNEDWGDNFEDVGDVLNYSLLQTYNHRLQERRRRYRIIREHGLLVPARMSSWLAKHSEAFNLKRLDDKQISSGRFTALLQLTSGIAFDRIVEGLQYEKELRKFLLRLYELRSNGIGTFHGGKIYQKLRYQRASKLRIKSTIMLEWKHLALNGSDTVLSGTDKIIKHCRDLNHIQTKRKSTPLDIVGLPNYEKLNTDEQELCRQIRVIPDAYLAYKKLLMAENLKMGYLRLADARRLIKIDVNKTRRLFDFLFEKGFVNKAQQDQ